jgi:hypothetical protein
MRQRVWTYYGVVCASLILLFSALWLLSTTEHEPQPNPNRAIAGASGQGDDSAAPSGLPARAKSPTSKERSGAWRAELKALSHEILRRHAEEGVDDHYAVYFGDSYKERLSRFPPPGLAFRDKDLADRMTPLQDRFTRIAWAHPDSFRELVALFKDTSHEDQRRILLMYLTSPAPIGMPLGTVDKPLLPFSEEGFIREAFAEARKESDPYVRELWLGAVGLALVNHPRLAPEDMQFALDQVRDGFNDYRHALTLVLPHLVAGYFGEEPSVREWLLQEAAEKGLQQLDPSRPAMDAETYSRYFRNAGLELLMRVGRPDDPDVARAVSEALGSADLERRMTAFAYYPTMRRKIAAGDSWADAEYVTQLRAAYDQDPDDPARHFYALRIVWMDLPESRAFLKGYVADGTVPESMRLEALDVVEQNLGKSPLDPKAAAELKLAMEGVLQAKGYSSKLRDAVTRILQVVSKAASP